VRLARARKTERRTKVPICQAGEGRGREGGREREESKYMLVVRIWTRKMCLLANLHHPSRCPLLSPSRACSPPKQSSIVSNACCHRSTGMPPHPTASLVHAGDKTTHREAARDRPTRRRGMTTEEAEEGGREGGGGAGGEEVVELAVRAAAFLLWTPMATSRPCFLH